MCTVTYSPSSQGGILTSNRDEQGGRNTLAPQKYTPENLIYPKDIQSNGSWIVLSKTRWVCLLNGGFQNHTPKPNYNVSRGVIVMKSIKSGNLREFCQSIDLTETQPFTLLMNDFKGDDFLEMVWDGEKKHLRYLDQKDSYIWSSSTLYNDEMKAERKKWFRDFFDTKKKNASHLLEFHQTHFTENSEYDLLMKRPNGIQTVSISQIVTSAQNSNFYYLDRQENSETKIAFFDEK